GRRPAPQPASRLPAFRPRRPFGRCPRRRDGRAARLCGRGGGRALSRGDEIAHRLLIALTEQLDRVGGTVDDRLEENLAVLVGGQRALGPAAHLVQELGEPRVWRAVLIGDLRLYALGERGAGAGGGDRNRERAGAEDRRENEVAERRHVHHVDEHGAALGVLVYADVHVGVVRCVDD